MAPRTYDNLVQLLDQQAARYGDKTFLRVPSPRAGGAYTDVSFKAFRQLVPRVARALEQIVQADLGTQRFGFLSPNSFEYSAITSAVVCCGGSVVPLNVGFPADVVLHLLKVSKAATLIVAPPFLKLARQLKSPGKLPDLRIVCVGPAPQSHDGLVRYIDVWDILFNGSLNSAAQSRDLERYMNFNLELDRVAIVLHTTGSTSMPKLVPLSHRNILHNAQCVHDARKEYFTDQDMTLGWLPFFHVMGMMFEFFGNMFVGAAYAFAKFRPGPPTADQLMKSLIESKATVFYTVPKMLEGLREIAMKDPKALKTLQNLNFIMSGGAAMSTRLGTSYLQMGVNLIQGEGMTEVAGAILLGNPRRNDPDKWKTLYILPQIIHKWVPRNESSTSTPCKELMLSTANDTLMRGYLVQSGALEQTNVNDGWFETRDLFIETPTGGYVWIGRRDEVFVHVNGEKTNPQPIEFELEKCPVVQKAALIGHAKPFNIVVIQVNSKNFAVKQQTEQVVWQFITEKINPLLPRHSFIRRTSLIITDKAIPTSPKGNLLRRQVDEVFATEIATKYQGTSSL